MDEKYLKMVEISSAGELANELGHLTGKIRNVREVLDDLEAKKGFVSSVLTEVTR